MTKIQYRPIGIIHTPFKTPTDVPIQAIGGKGVQGTIELDSEFQPALKDLDGFSHIILIFHFHLVKGFKTEVKPFLDEAPRGLFATRAPKRPNPIGISVVQLIKIEERTLYIQDLDIVDNTPLLDIKPYVPWVDSHLVERIGWLEDKKDDFVFKRSDNRFE